MLLLLETGLDPLSFKEEWEDQRQAWRQRVREAENFKVLLSLLVKFYEALDEMVLSREWEDFQEEWKRKLNSVVGNGA